MGLSCPAQLWPGGLFLPGQMPALDQPCLAKPEDWAPHRLECCPGTWAAWSPGILCFCRRAQTPTIAPLCSSLEAVKSLTDACLERFPTAQPLPCSPARPWAPAVYGQQWAALGAECHKYHRGIDAAKVSIWLTPGWHSRRWVRSIPGVETSCSLVVSMMCPSMPRCLGRVHLSL